MIPVDTPWHYTTPVDALDHWQTVIAGVLALLAGLGTVVATMIIADRQITASAKEADRQIAASREEADKVITASRAQTEATFKQTETTVRLERERDASEATAFAAMVEARHRASSTRRLGRDGPIRSF